MYIIYTSVKKSRDRVFIAISLCGHRRTNTARRRGVPLAPTAPASAKTNRAVRVGHAVSSESKRTAILRTGFVTLTRQQNHTKPHIYLPPLPNRRAPPPFARRAAPPFYCRSLVAMSSSSSSSSSPSPSRSASSATTSASSSASAPRHAPRAARRTAVRGAAAAAVARLERRARAAVAAREADAAGGERKQPEQRRGALEPQSETELDGRQFSRRGGRGGRGGRGERGGRGGCDRRGRRKRRAAEAPSRRSGEPSRPAELS